jgi:hypothetical protein
MSDTIGAEDLKLPFVEVLLNNESSPPVSINPVILFGVERMIGTVD